jgi:hypothetical protein
VRRPGTSRHRGFSLVHRLADLEAFELRAVEDPTMWTRPWTAVVPMRKSEYPIYEYACHEGNYAMTGILAGARAREKTAEEAAKKGPSRLDVESVPT